MAKEKKVKQIELNPVTLMAALVSLCALFLSVYQTQLQKKQQYASVWPHLRLYHLTQTNDSIATWSLHIANYGVGPAVIKSVDIELNGVPIASMSALVDTIHAIGSREIDGATKDLVGVGDFLPAGQDLEWISTVRDKKDAKIIQEKLSTLHVRIKYASVYNESWEVCSNCPDNTLNYKIK